MIAFLAYVVLSIYVLWIFYLAVMTLQRARDAGILTRTAFLLGSPILWIGLLIDFLVNMVPMTLLFMEFPREWLVTPRLSRHVRGVPGWRKDIALWFALNLLDVFDPSGKHIK